MSYTPRHTATIAREDLYGTGGDNPGHLNRLLTLTSGDPTTAELEEAVKISRMVTARLLVWVSARHLTDGHQTMTGPEAEELAQLINPDQKRPLPTPPDITFGDAIEAQKDAESRQMAEAEQISKAHCTVIDPIGDALAMVRPPHLT